jgi:hypothetical protein
MAINNIHVMQVQKAFMIIYGTIHGNLCQKNKTRITVDGPRISIKNIPVMRKRKNIYGD